MEFLIQFLNIITSGDLGVTEPNVKIFERCANQSAKGIK